MRRDAREAALEISEALLLRGLPPWEAWRDDARTVDRAKAPAEMEPKEEGMGGDDRLRKRWVISSRGTLFLQLLRLQIGFLRERPKALHGRTSAAALDVEGGTFSLSWRESQVIAKGHRDG